MFIDNIMHLNWYFRNASKNIVRTLIKWKDMAFYIVSLI
jgi:hypothetical protein